MARVAYFSMEIALRSDLPTYSGGLGVLAGDTIRSAADLEIPMVAVSLLYRKGYVNQQLDQSGWQHDSPVVWTVEDAFREQPQRVEVAIEGRRVVIRAWRYDVQGATGSVIPVYLLDAGLPENAEEDRALSDSLYAGDPRYRLCQEAILGIGGVRMLRALGYTNIDCFHLNEGHAALLGLELLEERWKRAGNQPTPEDIHAVQQQCVFTTHTPMPAGHDAFPMELATSVLGPRVEWQALKYVTDGMLNMTHIALNLSRYVNAVAKKHGEITRKMFPDVAIDAITNGVHLATWAAPSFQALFDRHIPGWKEDNSNIRYALKIPRPEVWEAHQQAKQRLIDDVNRRTNAGMDPAVFTLGFARRAAAYKRADLLFRNIERLQSIAVEAGAIQILYAGKAHPHDRAGKELIQRIFQVKSSLGPKIKFAYLENYDMELGRVMTSGVDLWLNTPQPPLEASGTSGMKAAINGVPSLSVLDGWWIEGHLEGVTGWAIGEPGEEREIERNEMQDTKDARALYAKLEHTIMPLFYRNRDDFIDVMRHTIALNGSFFNTQRMMRQYVVHAYF